MRITISPLLGKLLYDSRSAALSVNLLRTICALVTRVKSSVSLSTLLNAVISNQPWRVELGKELVAQLAKAERGRRLASEVSGSELPIISTTNRW